MPKVTIVIATYNRPTLLRWAIQTVLDQTMQDWILLVIGDRCEASTGDIVRSFSDDRIFYLNLGERCGEQSGPNTAGFFAATTEFVAFLNHDDLWLPDHLERALSVLEESEAEFYCGAAAFTAVDHRAETDENRMFIQAVSPKRRTVEEGMLRSPAYFEPVSTWVMRRELLTKVGAWKPASTIYRTPLEDWIMRAWRADIVIAFDDTVTALYCNGKVNHDDGSGTLHYDTGDQEQSYWFRQIEDIGADRIREKVRQETNDEVDWFEHTHRSSPGYHIYEALQNDQTVKLYKEFGWDGFDEACRLMRRPLGFRLKRMLKRRTGENLSDQENWKGISYAVKATLKKKQRWQDMNNNE